jgi:hypothetical protein
MTVYNKKNKTLKFSRKTAWGVYGLYTLHDIWDALRRENSPKADKYMFQVIKCICELFGKKVLKGAKSYYFCST